MYKILPINHPETKEAPAHVIEKAKAHNKKILKIVWDKAGGYPRHSWGFAQWSTRPFTQRQGCDGTIDDNVHLIALTLCRQLGIDYADIHTQAYEWQNRGDQGQWIREWSESEISELAKETVIPALSEESLKSLLYDLNDINNRSVIELLEEKFSALGYNVEKWWES